MELDAGDLEESLKDAGARSAGVASGSGRRINGTHLPLQTRRVKAREAPERISLGYEDIESRQIARRRRPRGEVIGRIGHEGKAVEEALKGGRDPGKPPLRPRLRHVFHFEGTKPCRRKNLRLSSSIRGSSDLHHPFGDLENFPESMVKASPTLREEALKAPESPTVEVRGQSCLIAVCHSPPYLHVSLSSCVKVISHGQTCSNSHPNLSGKDFRSLPSS